MNKIMLGIIIFVVIISALIGGIVLQSISQLQIDKQRVEEAKESNLLDKEIQQCIVIFDCKSIDSKVDCLEEILKSNKISQEGTKRIQDSIQNERDFCVQSSSVSPNSESDEGAKIMVLNAIKLYDEIGTDSFESFNSSPDFHNGDLYMFVFQYSDSVMVSHGANRALIGESVDKILDIYGNSIGKMIHDQATEEGVWIEYLWLDPTDQQTHVKNSWVVKHDGYIFGSGKYNQAVPVQSPIKEQSMLIHTEPVVVTIPVGSPLLGCENLNTCFVPYMTEINPGESVIWKNIDSNPHTITSGITTLEETLQNRYYNQEHDDLFDSGMILASQSFQFTFSNQGEYHYYCSVHPWMTGIVSVR